MTEALTVHDVLVLVFFLNIIPGLVLTAMMLWLAIE